MSNPLIHPLVSIIIPVFNREKELELTLDSVIAQSYGNWECIMVDDGSTDGSLAIFDKYIKMDNRFQGYSRNRLPKGAPTCRNMGLKASKGDYIIFLDSDDYLMEHCLHDRVVFVQKFDQCLFWVFPMGIKHDDGVSIKSIPQGKDYLVEFLSYKIHWQTMCVFWSRDAIIKLKGFRENFPRFNDPELMIRGFLLANKNFEISHQSPFDSVYQPDIKNIRKFKSKVYDSILVLLPNVIDDLNQAGKSDYKKYLIGFMNGWFMGISAPLKGMNYFQDVKIVRIFYKYGIITKYKLLAKISNLSLYSINSLMTKAKSKIFK